MERAMTGMPFEPVAILIRLKFSLDPADNIIYISG